MRRKTFAEKIGVRQLVTVAAAAAVSFILMLLQINLPIAPDFIKFDLSDIPALIMSFTFGPITGILTALLKNLIHLFITSTGGIGELSNFLLSCAFVVPAGIIYKRKKTRSQALIAMLIGTICLAITGMLSNYYIMFPFYSKFMPLDKIIEMCREIVPFIDSKLKVILFSVTPVNLIKGFAISVITFLIYKRLSPIIKGK